MGGDDWSVRFGDDLQWKIESVANQQEIEVNRNVQHNVTSCLESIVARASTWLSSLMLSQLSGWLQQTRIEDSKEIGIYAKNKNTK